MSFITATLSWPAMLNWEGRGCRERGCGGGEQPWVAGAPEAGVRVPLGCRRPLLRAGSAGEPGWELAQAGGSGEPVGCRQLRAGPCCQGARWLQLFRFANAHFTFQL